MNDEIADIPIYEEEEVTPKDLLLFGKLILLGVSLIFCLGMLCDMINQNVQIFEACKTILPPIATLIIGYYFAKS